TGVFATALGDSSSALANGAVAISVDSKATGVNSMAIGSESNATHDNSVAIGAGSVSKKEVPVNQATIGKTTYVGFAGNNPVATFSVGAKNKERQIVNVAAGEISATSTDAINGSQLYTIAQAVENLASNPPVMCLTMYSTDNNINIDQIDEGTFDYTLNKDLTNLNTVTLSTDSSDTTTVTTDGMNIRYYDSPNGMEYNTSYNHNGLTIKRNDGDANPIDEVSLTVDGLNNGGKRIINVKEGSKGTDAVNVNQLNKVREENQQITEKVTRNGDKITQLENDVVKNTTKITENTKAIESNTDYIKAIEKKLPVVEAGKNTTVTTSTDANGKITYTVSSKDFQPAIDKVDDKVNKNTNDIGDLTKRVTTNEGNITSNTNRISTLEKQLPEVEAGENVKVTTATDANGKKTYTVATAKDVNFNNVTVGDVVIGKDGVNAGNQTIINVKDGVNGTDAVNVNQLKSVDNKVNQNAQGIAENKQAIASIDKRHSVVEQGKNTKVTSRKGSNGETIYTVSTADDLTVKSVTFVDGPVINNNGINANNTKVTNVKEGTADTDAVNVAQLNRVKSAVNGNTAKINKLNTRVDGLDRDVRKNRKRADAGTASVAAMANIPQVYLPGKSGVGVGVGYKHGQSAIAVGYSKASDNSKHIVKLSVGADSQKDVTLGAGYMYQW
ncbi:YadA family autotransporter adhesin, partial [Haemophilus sp.]